MTKFGIFFLFLFWWVSKIVLLLYYISNFYSGVGVAIRSTSSRRNKQKKNGKNQPCPHCAHANLSLAKIKGSYGFARFAIRLCHGWLQSHGSLVRELGCGSHGWFKKKKGRLVYLEHLGEVRITCVSDSS